MAGLEREGRMKPLHVWRRASVFSRSLLWLPLLTSMACSADPQPAPVSNPIAALSYRDALGYATEGGFDYDRLRSDYGRGVLIRDATDVATQPKNADSAKAYWIDAYNRNVIASVLGSEVVTSVMDTQHRFFDDASFTHFGQKLSLNDIEKKILFSRFPDARLHYALVCGAQSCPPLYDSPFSEAEDLNGLLDSLTARSINDTLFVRFDHDEGKVFLSKLFDWYAKDFELEAGSVMEFIARYHNDGDAILERAWKTKFRDYDWSLNQRPQRSK
jgi:hypothetical protein